MNEWDMIGENIRVPKLVSSIFSDSLWDRSFRRGRRRWEDAAQVLSTDFVSYSKFFTYHISRTSHVGVA
jgi:hypothetical protein